MPYLSVPQYQIDNVLKSEWSGTTWLQRNENLSLDTKSRIIQTVKRGIQQGQSVDQMARELRKSAKITKNSSKRLIRSESNYMLNQGSLLGYKELNVKKYRYEAFLDNRTSEICRSLDGQVFLVKNATVNVNYPPMHPNCRSTTTEEIGQVRQERLARDLKTGELIQVPGDVS